MQSRHREICAALMIEADDDFKAAETLMKAGFHSKTVYYCQQTVEKALKAALAMNGITITDEHMVSGHFNLLFSRFNQLKGVVENAETLEAQGSKPRYPIFGDPVNEIWIPSQKYKGADCQKAIKTARFVLEKITAFLKEKYGVKA
ncbi:MAG: HEPN domain-containing protein [Candidatus Woesearchaeota archaeon]